MFRPVVTESVAPESVRSGLVLAFLGAAAEGADCFTTSAEAEDGGGTRGAGGGTNGGGAGIEGAPIHIVIFLI